jgi:hypothetical protein
MGFETPFENQLNKNNRWVKLSSIIPWDGIVNLYNAQFKAKEGRPPINGRVIIGAVIIKHMLDLTDEETVLQIQENMFMQYFLGYCSFTNEIPFDASLFVMIRKRLNSELLSSISQICLEQNGVLPHKEQTDEKKSDSGDATNMATPNKQIDDSSKEENTLPNQGKLLMDATVSPQAITFPTDMKLLDAARRKSEHIIDLLHEATALHLEKPRTYRENARKDFLNIAKKKNVSHRELYKGIGAQIRYLKRNLTSIEKQLNICITNKIANPLGKKNLEYLKTLQVVLTQQSTMYDNNVRTIADRIVSIHQPHVRPMVRGKAGKRTEFGSKMHISLINGFTFIDKLSWDSFNEGQCLKQSVEAYKTKFGFYPKEVLVDQIYTNRENRNYLKELGIKLVGKALGRPRKDEALHNHVSPGERNPIEGKFGQAKQAYGLERVRAKLRATSESWISSIILVLNLVRLTRQALLCLNRWIEKIIFYAMLSKMKFSRV